ncbi:excinuclease ABC subunit UvrB [Alphaproteobacteria bacterium]|nr:excinuclease ABC subunit UvrB [Alphaproteobacteria bacterium]
MKFKLQSRFTPAGDQPAAIQKILSNIKKGDQDQVLLGVTGSGKTFTMAHVIQESQKPTLVLAPNKTLAAQLYGEMKEFFPNNAVEYFVSYYDYYQPEAYVPRRDLYIEKEATINDQIDRLRHSATRAILERRDVIIVASVSCIYGLGDVESYSKMSLTLKKNETIERQDLFKKFTELQYKRNDISFERGAFRVRGDTVEIFPVHCEDRAWRLSFFDSTLESIHETDPLTGERIAELSEVLLFANSHYVTPRPTVRQALKKIKVDLQERLQEFESQGKLVESQRLRERVTFDIELLEATGMCPGIENYSRYLTGRLPGQPPPTLFEYLPKDALLILDESHIGIPQLNAMYRGDRARKLNLSDYGFRLPACRDNRPLKFEEWDEIRPQTVFVSATPGPWELDRTKGEFIEQVIRPTGLLDPVCIIRPTESQIDDLISECLALVKKNQRALVTTLTKKTSEALTNYLTEVGLKVRYIHSDVDTIERIEIIRDLRLGVFDVLIGINLLREGLDIPECALVAILDADREGYLRSKTSLIQTIGRAARNIDGRAILYADKMTNSMKGAIEENNKRREKQEHYNLINGITPQSIKKNITNALSRVYEEDHPITDLGDDFSLKGKKLKDHLKKIEKQMLVAAEDLDFETATKLRDEIRRLEKKDLL